MKNYILLALLALAIGGASLAYAQDTTDHEKKDAAPVIKAVTTTAAGTAKEAATPTAPVAAPGGVFCDTGQIVKSYSKLIEMGGVETTVRLGPRVTDTVIKVPSMPDVPFTAQLLGVGLAGVRPAPPTKEKMHEPDYPWVSETTMRETRAELRAKGAKEIKGNIGGYKNIYDLHGQDYYCTQ